MTRDPARIDRICDLLRAFWHAHEGLRLGKLLCNLVPDEHTPLRKGSVELVEDEVIEAALEQAAPPPRVPLARDPQTTVETCAAFITAMARHYPEAVFPEKRPGETWPCDNYGLTLASASLARHLARTWAEAMRRDLAAHPLPGAAQGTP